MSLPLTTVARGEDSGIVTPREVVVRDAAAWRALWAAHAGPRADPPVVDFTASIVAAVFAGERPDPSRRIEITGGHQEAGAIVLTVREPSAGPGAVAAQILVAPFHIVTLPRFEGDVRFERRGVLLPRDGVRPAAGTAAVPGPGAMPTGQGGPSPWQPAPSSGNATSSSGHGVSSTGLEPNFAAALAYLAGPFSGLLILAIERRSRYVTFHAWQALLGLGGLAAIAAAALVSSFLTLLLSPLAFTIMYRFSEVAAALWVAAWVWCLLMAFTGRPAKLPVAGRHAERLAAGRERSA